MSDTTSIDTAKPDNAAKVIVYSTTWCAFCHTEMQWLEKIGIPFIAKDIEADKEAYDELMGKIDGNFVGVPVTDVAGDIVLGFDRPKIQEAIKSRGIEAVAA